MPKFNVMEASAEEQARHDADPKYVAVGTVLCQLEARNEMLAQKYHKDGIFEKKYPRGSWIEPE